MRLALILFFVWAATQVRCPGELVNQPAVASRPVFEVSLVYRDPADGLMQVATEIELKASTNNFSSLSRFAYWGDTLHTNLPGYASFETSDDGLQVFFSDFDDAGSDGNTRDLREFINDGSGGMLTDAIGAGGYVSTVLLCPSAVDHNGNPYGWMTEGNTAVVWTIHLRGVSDAGPTNAAGDLLWQVKAPAYWTTGKINAE